MKSRNNRRPQKKKRNLETSKLAILTDIMGVIKYRRM
jgi:hypothetical protein